MLEFSSVVLLLTTLSLVAWTQCVNIKWHITSWRSKQNCSQLFSGTMHIMHNTTTTTVLRLFVRDYPGQPVPEETLTHPPSSSSSNLYQLLPSTTIHSILLVRMTCLAIVLHNPFPCPLWSTFWSGALHLIFHTFLHPISVFFSQHMPIPSQIIHKWTVKLDLGATQLA